MYVEIFYGSHPMFHAFKYKGCPGLSPKCVHQACRIRKCVFKGPFVGI